MKVGKVLHTIWSKVNCPLRVICQKGVPIPRSVVHVSDEIFGYYIGRYELVRVNANDYTYLGTHSGQCELQGCKQPSRAAPFIVSMNLWKRCS